MKKGPRARKPAEATKASQILQYAAEHPEAGYKDISEVLGSHEVYVRQVLRKYGKPKPAPFTGGKSLVPENGQSDLSMVVKQCKTLRQIGLQRVRELLSLLEAIHGK